MSASESPHPLAPTEIIIGVDYDLTCHAAARHGLALAQVFGVQARLLHISASPYAGHTQSTQTSSSYDERDVLQVMRHNEVQAMEAFVTSLGVDGSVPWNIESGDPKSVLLDFAHQSPGRWVVLGARKHAVLSEWFLGSTAGYVVRHCQVPVLVVPPQSPSLQPKPTSAHGRAP